MDVRKVLVAGLVASVVMGMVQMVYEGIAGAGFWSPVVFIAATILRGLQSVQIPVPFDLVGIVVGLMGHMMNSVIFGFIFVAILGRFAMSRPALAGIGIVYSLVIFAMMWYAIVPAVDPVMLRLNGTVFAIAHMMWGAGLGLLIPQRAQEASPRLETA